MADLKLLLETNQQRNTNLRPMTIEESKMFMTMSMTESKEPVELLASELENFLTTEYSVSIPFALAVFARRLLICKEPVKYSPFTVIFLTSLCNSPGNVVMWAHTLYHLTKNNGKAVTITDLAFKYMSDGVPKDEVYEQRWDEQKDAKHGNRLDYAESYI